MIKGFIVFLLLATLSLQVYQVVLLSSSAPTIAVAPLSTLDSIQLTMSNAILGTFDALKSKLDSFLLVANATE